MKYLFTFLLLFSFCYNGHASVYDKLCDVNKLWEENDVASIQFPKNKQRTSQEWIQLHLSLVEQILRSRNIDNLSAEQKLNRNTALDHLHEYWLAGKFPQNTEYNYRTPIFIDKYDNFCAVGYLVKATGHEEVSRMISSATNLAYVREMHYPELDNWAKEYGFTKDELAWIQPSYPPNNYAYSVANGTNGNVNELFVDGLGDKLYVGGLFSKVDDTMSIANIGYVTEVNDFYAWHKLGNGLNGIVTAITEYNNDIIAAGSFTASGSTTVNNVAKWDGQSWAAFGCLSGVVTDMIVFQGDLYACGKFDICGGDTAVTFAKWDAGNWNAIAGMKGKVNTLMIADTLLYLGGAFEYNTVQINAIRWNNNIGFKTFNTAPQNEVNALTRYGDTLYAGCKMTSTIYPAPLEICVNDTWEIDTSRIVTNMFGAKAIRSFCTLADTILAGGSFTSYMDLIRMENCIPVKNFTNVVYHGFNNSFNVDSTINKFTIFNNKIIVGGDFSKSLVYRSLTPDFSAYYYSRNICKDAYSGTITMQATGGQLPYSYLWSTGDTTIILDSLTAGIYSVTIIDGLGRKQVLHVDIHYLGFTQPLQYDSSNQRLSAQIGFDEYKFVNCDDNYRTIGRSRTNSLLISRDGNYACIVERDGCIDTSDCIYVKIFPENVAAISSMDGTTVYPNPVQELLHIKTEIYLNDITILDVAGRIVLNEKVNSRKDIQLNTAAFSSGYYTVIITTADGNSKQYKLIKE